MRFLSRLVKWIRVSIPTRCRIMTASASALILTRAMGLSPMLIASAPASLTSWAPAIVFWGLSPRGGSISTLIVKPPSRKRRAKGVSSVSSVVQASIAIGAGWVMEARAREPAAPGVSAARMAAMWAGVVPQQPPR